MKKKFPFKYGQRVCNKKNKKICYVRSYGPACLGKDNHCRLPGGPIVFEDMVLVETQIEGKTYICLEYVDELTAC